MTQKIRADQQRRTSTAVATPVAGLAIDAARHLATFDATDTPVASTSFEGFTSSGFVYLAKTCVDLSIVDPTGETYGQMHSDATVATVVSVPTDGAAASVSRVERSGHYMIGASFSMPPTTSSTHHQWGLIRCKSLVYPAPEQVISWGSGRPTHPVSGIRMENQLMLCPLKAGDYVVPVFSENRTANVRIDLALIHAHDVADVVEDSLVA